MGWGKKMGFNLMLGEVDEKGEKYFLDLLKICIIIFMKYCTLNFEL